MDHLIFTWNGQDCTDTSKISEAVNNNQYEIGQVITDLREFLTNTDQEKRSNGMKILSSILIELKKDILNKAEVDCLSEFFINRLKDQVYVIQNSLPGLKALCEFSHYDFQMGSLVFFTIQNELSVQMFKPDHKLQIYKIIQFLFERFRKEFVDIGSNFVYGFLQIVDTETSPICLKVIFELFYQVSSVPNFELFKEDIFESMACYFPIIYNKSIEDKHYETKVELSYLLNRAMSATRLFSEYLIQLALEKLESESEESKKSCYRLLQSALPVYTSEDVQPFLNELWTCVRIDCLKPNIENDDLAYCALSTLKILSDTISLDSTSTGSILEKMWKDLEISLKSPELNLITSTVRIFNAFSSTHVENFNYFFKKSHLILIQNFIFNSDVDDKISCLNSFCELLSNGRKIGVCFEKEEILKFFNLLIENSANSDQSIRKSVLLILNELISISQLEKEQLLILIYFVTNSVEQADYNIDTKTIALEVIKNLSLHQPETLYETYVSKIINEIDFSSLLTTSTFLQYRMLFLLDALRNSAYNILICNKLINIFVEKLITTLKDHHDPSFDIFSINLMETLKFCFKTHSGNEDFVKYFYECTIVKLLDFLFYQCFIQKCSISFKVIEQFAVLFAEFLGNLNKDCQIKKKVSEQFLQFLIEQNLSVFLYSFREDVDSLICYPTCAYNQNQSELVQYVTYAYIYSLDSNIENDVIIDIFKQFKSSVFDYNLTVSNSEKVTRLSCMILHQIILKLRFQNNHAFSIFLEEIFDELKGKIISEDVSEYHKLIIVNMLMWICKSMVSEKSPLMQKYLNIIFQFINEKTVQNSVLQLVEVIYSNDDFYQNISYENSLTPSKKFSEELHETLTRQYLEKNQNEILYLYLSHLKFIPQNILNSKLKDILMIILKGLELNELSNINFLSLNMIQNIINLYFEQVEEQIISLLKPIVLLAKVSPNYRIRKMALDCVCDTIDKSKEKDLLNFKTEYVKCLRPTLSDHKRLVRSSAVKAFCKLSMLGQPGNRRR